MKQPTRSFSLGLLSASLIILVVLLFANDDKHDVENITNEDKI